MHQQHAISLLKTTWHSFAANTNNVELEIGNRQVPTMRSVAAALIDGRRRVVCPSLRCGVLLCCAVCTCCVQCAMCCVVLVLVLYEVRVSTQLCPCFLGSVRRETPFVLNVIAVPL